MVGISLITRKFLRRSGGESIARRPPVRFLWPTRLSRAFPVLFAVLLFVSGLTADVLEPSRMPDPMRPQIRHERDLTRLPNHRSEFASVYQTGESHTCEETRPPEALLTPDPLLDNRSDDLNVRISFIIGPDGRVHSAFIMESDGRNHDQVILRAVQKWRYRPALCNGVPTPVEGRVSFVIR